MPSTWIGPICPLAQFLAERYHLPVYDAERQPGRGDGRVHLWPRTRPAESNLVVINARHGIGAGIVIDGQLFQGDGGGAGEIGHIAVVPKAGCPAAAATAAAWRPLPAPRRW